MYLIFDCLGGEQVSGPPEKLSRPSEKGGEQQGGEEGQVTLQALQVGIQVAQGEGILQVQVKLQFVLLIIEA